MDIWLPVSTTKVTVQDGELKVWDEMEMERRPIPSPLGFGKQDTEDKEQQ